RSDAPEIGDSDVGLPARGANGTDPRNPDPGTDHRVLKGVRVLDFTHVVAGPIATRILADHGAEVLKVERRVTLDLGERRGGFFGNLNRGKKSLILNMSDPRGIDIARRLA